MQQTAYTDGRYQENYPPGIEHHFWNRARNAIIARALDSAGMSSGKLLEIGCGTGVVLDYLRRRGTDCVGCDLGHAPVPPHLRSAVFSGSDFRHLPEDLRRSFNGVLLCDVIEHLAGPIAFLRSIREHLPGVRRLLITVPARKELWSVWDEHFGHHRRYDRQSLRDEIMAGGFTPDTIGYFFHALYLPILLTRRWRSTSTTAPSRRLAHAHALVSQALYLDYRATPPWLPGSSLIAVATAVAP